MGPENPAEIVKTRHALTIHGIYDTAEEALTGCRRLVNISLNDAYRPGISAEALYSAYTNFGNDPFIIVMDGADSSATFSAWGYAKERCRGELS